MRAVARYATCGDGSGAPRRQWRLRNSGLRIRLRWCFESAVHAIAVRAGSRARMVPMVSSQMPPVADDAPSMARLYLLASTY